MRQHLITYMIHRLKQLLSIDWGLYLGIFVGDCSKGGVGILVVFSKPVPLVGLSAVVVVAVAGVVACFSEGCCGDKSHRGILDAGSPVSSIDSKCPSIGEDIV